jgi:hypothetical protein
MLKFYFSREFLKIGLQICTCTVLTICDFFPWICGFLLLKVGHLAKIFLEGIDTIA